MTTAKATGVALMSGVGCGAVSSTGTQVTVEPLPAIAIRGGATICFGGSTTLTPWAPTEHQPIALHGIPTGLGSGDTKTLAPAQYNLPNNRDRTVVVVPVLQLSM